MLLDPFFWLWMRGVIKKMFVLMLYDSQHVVVRLPTCCCAISLSDKKALLGPARIRLAEHLRWCHVA